MLGCQQQKKKKERKFRWRMEKGDYFIAMRIPFLLKENDEFVWNKRAAFICSLYRFNLLVR